MLAPKSFLRGFACRDQVSLWPSPARARFVFAAAVLGAGIAAAGCGASNAPGGRIVAVGAENEYANVISQVGGRYVQARAIESNPNTDPHAFEASPSVASEVSSAGLIVQNGLGYDDYMNKIEAGSSSSSRIVIDVQRLLGLRDSAPNPHLWYMPSTMPAVANAIAAGLSKIQSGHAGYFRANAAQFVRSLTPWYEAIKRFRASNAGSPVATTEPVGDYMLEAAGAINLTPFTFQADVMNGVDPAPQNVSLEDRLFSSHRVRALLYNRQVTDSLTQGFLHRAQQARIPIVALYETMPPGYDYQSWMLAEVNALRAAVERGTSTQKL
jgi:zinc/manganese transport system substrate-binding protein